MLSNAPMAPFVTPDQLSVKADAYLGTLFVGVEAIVIDNQHFITNPLSGEWSEVSPEDSPLSFLNPAGLIANILGLVREADYASLPKPGEDLVIEAVISSYALSPLVGDVIEGVDVDLVLTFDPASFVLKSGADQRLAPGARRTGRGPIGGID